jgi:DNA-binding transcriptional ArsR family regulator
MSARPQFIARDVDVVPAASLLADSTRAAMLTALLDDRPLAAGELARLAGVSPATASAHLARLLDGGLVVVIRQGRHRYYRLAGPEVAAALEALAHLSPAMPVRSLRESTDAAALRTARTCYDHLAGRAGVALLDALLARGILAPAPNGGPPANRDRPDENLASAPDLGQPPDGARAPDGSAPDGSAPDGSAPDGGAPDGAGAPRAPDGSSAPVGGRASDGVSPHGAGTRDGGRASDGGRALNGGAPGGAGSPDGGVARDGGFAWGGGFARGGGRVSDGGSALDGGHATGSGHGPGNGLWDGGAPQAHTRSVEFRLTGDGVATLGSFGIDIGQLERTRRRFAGACLDWTERKPHLNGALGAAMTERLLRLGWIERGSRRRAVRVTPAGREGLAATFGWSLGD